KRILAEGMENIWKRQARIAAAARAGFTGMGLEIFPSPPNNALTVVKSPSGVNSSDLPGHLEKNYGLNIAIGQDTLKGKIIRLAHMGYIDWFDVVAAIAGVELALHDLEHRVDIGSGVAAAQQKFAQGT